MFCPSHLMLSDPKLLLSLRSNSAFLRKRSRRQWRKTPSTAFCRIRLRNPLRMKFLTISTMSDSFLLMLRRIQRDTIPRTILRRQLSALPLVTAAELTALRLTMMNTFRVMTAKPFQPRIQTATSFRTGIPRPMLRRTAAMFT